MNLVENDKDLMILVDNDGCVKKIVSKSHSKSPKKSHSKDKKKSHSKDKKIVVVKKHHSKSKSHGKRRHSHSKSHSKDKKIVVLANVAPKKIAHKKKSHSKDKKVIVVGSDGHGQLHVSHMKSRSTSHGKGRHSHSKDKVIAKIGSHISTKSRSHSKDKKRTVATRSFKEDPLVAVIRDHKFDSDDDDAEKHPFFNKLKKHFVAQHFKTADKDLMILVDREDREDREDKHERDLINLIDNDREDKEDREDKHERDLILMNLQATQTNLMNL